MGLSLKGRTALQSVHAEYFAFKNGEFSRINSASLFGQKGQFKNSSKQCPFSFNRVSVFFMRMRPS